MTQQQITESLRTIVHPETGADIVSSGMVERVEAAPDKVSVTLAFPKGRDPFAASIRRQVIQQITDRDPSLAGKITVVVKEAAPKKAAPAPEKRSAADRIRRVIAVASGKGGVGKSTVTANLAVALARLGYKVGVLDADIYGPSQPRMFGVEGYLPPAVKEGDEELMIPAEAYGVKIMSIGFFIAPTDALVWRGPMATNALRQMIHQTRWGELDFLLTDLPPGTGDVHLTILQELKVDGAVIVSTPQQVALADVVRGIQMFRAPKIEIPVLGIIENMAWFTPAELPENRYYLFGKGGAQALAEREGIALLGQIPIIQSVMEGAENGRPVASEDSLSGEYYREAARKTAEKTGL